MRIAITGSSGLIGSALVASLEADGHTPVRVVRSDGGPGTVRWDIEAGHIDAAGLEGLDGVVHLAGRNIGAKRWTPDEKRRLVESRTVGTTLLTEALAGLHQRPAVLVSASAVGIYGGRGDERLTEASGSGSGFFPDLVQAWEAAAEPARLAGIRVVHPRSGAVLSPEGGALQKLAMFARLGILGPVAGGGQWMSWISLPDEVAAIRFLLEHDLAGPVNCCSPNPVTNRELTKTLGRVLHRPTIFPIPSFGPKLMVGTELAENLVLDSQKVVPERLLAAGFEFRYPEIEPALRAALGRD